MDETFNSILTFLINEFNNEINFFNSSHWLGKTAYAFYAIAAFSVFFPHKKQALIYKNGKAGKGDFHHGAHYEAMFWRLAPLGYSIAINSKLLFISVFIDLIGRTWIAYEANKSEKRFSDLDLAPKENKQDEEQIITKTFD